MSKEPETDIESVKIALDQLTQTLDVMRRVVERLKTNVDLAHSMQIEETGKIETPIQVAERENTVPKDRRITDDSVTEEESEEVKGAYIYDAPIILH